MHLRTCTALAVFFAACATAAASGCAGDEPGAPFVPMTAGSGGEAGSGGSDADAEPGGSGGAAGDDASTGGSDAGDAGDADIVDAPPDVPDSGPVDCPVTFQYKPGTNPGSLLVTGEWNGFDLGTAAVMSATGGGSYEGTVHLQPGLHGYKFVVDGDWRLDPEQGRRKYVGGVENSGVKVADCRLPTFTVQSSLAARPSAGAGTYAAALRYNDGIEAAGAQASGFTATLEHHGTSRALTASELQVDAATGDVSVSLSGLEDGKYRVALKGKTKNGRTGEPLRLVFWIEAEAFSWKDAIVYMVLTDRYRDGDATNNPGPSAGADPRGDWQGGDLEGLRQSIADGTLDKLGVRAIWLTPFQTNPEGAYPASDNFHQVTGYHGYWPTRARQVDSRLGGENALRDLVHEAHRHGIRILQDYVLNHVHEDHEYVASHPEWFRTGCVCGGPNCDWTDHALDCMFAGYLPDINHSVPEANAAIVNDAVWWLDEFDLDGLRVDAVKHVEEVATRNLAAEVREGFEAAGTRYFLMGETAMGWNNCADPCNDDNYNTISKYIGRHGLDGQFDFVLYHGVSGKTFASEEEGMLHADYWFKHGQSKWPADAIMTAYIGSHDTPRFTTLADPSNAYKAGNQWDDIAGAPSSILPYQRTRVGLAWLLALPGAPLLYYGDEYGQWGGVDPNNRLMWRAEAALTADEKATLAFVRDIGAARRSIPALRRGDYLSLYVNEDTLVFGRRIASGNAAIVGLTRSSAPVAVTTEVMAKLGFAAATQLQDRLGGPGAAVAGNGNVSFTIPARSAVILAP